MLFNSFEFAVFLPLVFILYWFIFNRNLKVQNLLLLIVSYIFYGWWDWRFLSLLIFSTIVDYTIGILLSREENQNIRKLLLWFSITVNLGLLCVFKYYNWFIESLYEVVPGLNVGLGFNTLNIILPIGISFYTFQTLSYTIDVYKKHLEPTKDLISFSAFVTFFPQLVAGPIERASHLLPQFHVKRNFVYKDAVNGLRQILWGLFKKIVIADNSARYANLIFNNSEDYGGSTLIIGALFFTFQIYGDFSGYSDIAIGTARLFGFNLMKNFSYPYFSRDIAEFWRRWHISLSTWFRDYLYVPLGGSRGSLSLKVRNTFIIFIVSGVWHGANWTFVIWGFLNAIYFLPLLLTKNNRRNIKTVASGRTFPNIKEISSILFTFTLTVFAWIFFRAENIAHAFSIIGKIFSISFFDVPQFSDVDGAIYIAFIIGIFLIIEWFGRNDEFALESLGENWKRPPRYAVYYTLICTIFWYGLSAPEQEFIYFQF